MPTSSFAGVGPARSPRLARLAPRAWLRIAAERRRLARLDADQLADLGLSPEEARREAGRHFWDIPLGRV